MAPEPAPAGSSGHRGHGSNDRVTMHLRTPSQDPNRSNGYRGLVLRNRLNALLVDSHRAFQMIHKTFLRSYGVQTHELDNGRDAINLLASGHSFDLIVIENSLPFLNGIELTRQIRAMGLRSRIVGTTGGWSNINRRAFFDAGADEYAAKPIAPNRLMSIVLELDGQL